MELQSWHRDSGDIGAWSASSSLDIGTLHQQFEASQSDDASVDAAGASPLRSRNQAVSESHGIPASRVLLMGAHDDSFASTFRSEDSQFHSPRPHGAARSPTNSALWDSPIVRIPGTEDATSADASPAWAKAGTVGLQEEEPIKGPTYSPLDVVNSSLSGFEDQVCLIRDYVEHNSSVEQEFAASQRHSRHDTPNKPDETPTRAYASKEHVPSTLPGNARHASSLDTELSSLSLHPPSNQQEPMWDAERRDQLGPMISSGSRSSFNRHGNDAVSFDAKMRELKHDLHQNSADLREISALFRKLEYETKDVEATISDASFSVSRVVLASPYRSRRSDDWVEKLSQPRHTPEKIHSFAAKDKTPEKTGNPQKRTQSKTGEGSTTRRKTPAAATAPNHKPTDEHQPTTDAKAARQPLRYITPTRAPHSTSSKGPLVRSNQGAQAQPQIRNASPARASHGPSSMTRTLQSGQPAAAYPQPGDAYRSRNAAGHPAPAVSSSNNSVFTPEIVHRQKRTRSSARTPDLRFDWSLDLDASTRSGVSGSALNASRTVEGRQLMGSVNSAARWDALRQLARERGMGAGAMPGSTGSQRMPAQGHSRALRARSPAVISNQHPSVTPADSMRASQASSASRRESQAGAEGVDRGRAWRMHEQGDKWSIGFGAPTAGSHPASTAASTVGGRERAGTDTSDLHSAPDSVDASRLSHPPPPASATASAQRSKQYAELFPAAPADLTALAREVAMSLLAAADEVDDGSPVSS